MSPLNSIINNSKLCKNYLIDIFENLDHVHLGQRELEREERLSIDQLQALQQIKSIQQSGIMMHYFI
jgi:hypothetical protein